MTVFERSLELPISASEAWAWHARPGAFERLNPPWDPVRVLQPAAIADGERAHLQMKLGPLSVNWIAEHLEVEPNRRFVDRQVEGPFRSWRHEHLFEPTADGCVLVDRIEYEAPLGAAGAALGRIDERLDRLFRHRHRVLRGDLHPQWRASREGQPPGHRILVTGSNGLIGSALVPYLSCLGHDVRRLVRGPGAGSAEQPHWNPSTGELPREHLEGFDVVVHLAGEPVAGGRWSAAKRERIRRSRVDGTRLLAETLASLERPPRVLVSASAVGFYGDTDSAVDEDAPRGDTWLASVCADWEGAASGAASAGIRVVHPRIGVVLSAAGGALSKMLPAFQLGLGGPLGDGRQSLSLIGLDDALDVLRRCIVDDALVGPVNAVSPHPVRFEAFARSLGRALHRPAVMRVPSFALKMAFGADQATELLLAASEVLPRKLIDAGHQYRATTVDEMLQHALGTGRTRAEVPAVAGGG